ncbi:MAG TPA: glutamine--fructose-6-phosphate transaminase (isomerizing) [Nitrospiraceae bacterium]|nr:glutamine--fructose-6-phosphate transaminase (isomerizing) [Nitrospiraceae bacterium]
MCGIIGYIGKDPAVPVLVEGLKKLEYRGYDSSGIAVLENGSFTIRRAVGKLQNLENLLRGESITGRVGVGHVRWATHGRPSEENAHPHQAGSVVVVHNGIIENYTSLKQELASQGRSFESETDTEVIAHLVDSLVSGGMSLEQAVRKAAGRLQGAYAIAAVDARSPDVVVGARRGGPLVIGLGQGEFFLASDIPAILQRTRDVLFLNDDEMTVLSDEGVRITDLEGVEITRDITRVLWNPVMAEKGGYRHFMLKEIYEQPRAIMDTVRGRISQETGSIHLDEMGLANDLLRKVTRIFIVACGTSWHAGLVGKFMFEEIVGIPTEVDIASEFRYRNPLVKNGDLFIAITQSGETADTLAAMREAKARGATVAVICNVVGSTASREADGVVYTHAGPEIGVASTKAFTAQLTALYLLGLFLGRLQEKLSADDTKKSLADLVHIPVLVERCLEKDGLVEGIAKQHFRANDFLYLGRGPNYPVALEGALKLKEVSYIHAEGYPAGEMKHGPIALIDENLPVVVLAGKNSVYEKILANVEEVKARGGIVIALTTEGDADFEKRVDHSIPVPATNPLLMPLLMSIPLQLLAYHIAVLRGADVDQPRNLAKSVTVE